jgi:hypothetical protein
MARFTDKATNKAGSVPFWAGNPRGRVDEAADESYYWADESDPYGLEEPDIDEAPVRGWPEPVPRRYVRVAVRPEPRRADTRPIERRIAPRRRWP